MPDITKTSQNHADIQALIDEDRKSGSREYEPARIEQPITKATTKTRLQVTDLIKEDIQSGERKGNVYNQTNSNYEDFYMPINDALPNIPLIAKSRNFVKTTNECIKDYEIRINEAQRNAALKWENYLKGAKSVDTDVRYPLESEKKELINEKEKLHQQKAILKAQGEDTSKIDSLIIEVGKNITEVERTIEWVDQLHYIDDEIKRDFSESLIDLKALQAKITDTKRWKDEDEAEIIKDLLRLINGNDEKNIVAVKPSEHRSNGFPGGSDKNVLFAPIRKLPIPTINGVDLDVLATAIQYLPYQDEKNKWHYYTSSDFIGKYDYVHFSKECAWCARFISVVMRESGHGDLLDSVQRESMALADDWRKLFVNNESLSFVDIRHGQNNNYTPNAGEVAFFKFRNGSNNQVNHVGVVVNSYVDESGKTHIIVIEGNRASKEITGHSKNNKKHKIVNIFDYNIDDPNSGVVGFGNYDNFYMPNYDISQM